jgi:hypothetical protein
MSLSGMAPGILGRVCAPSQGCAIAAYMPADLRRARRLIIRSIQTPKITIVLVGGKRYKPWSTKLAQACLSVPHYLGWEMMPAGWPGTNGTVISVVISIGLCCIFGL